MWKDCGLSSPPIPFKVRNGNGAWAEASAAAESTRYFVRVYRAASRSRKIPIGNSVASEARPTPRIMMAIKISVKVMPRRWNSLAPSRTIISPPSTFRSLLDRQERIPRVVFGPVDRVCRIVELHVVVARDLARPRE